MTRLRKITLEIPLVLVGLFEIAENTEFVRSHLPTALTTINSGPYIIALLVAICVWLIARREDESRRIEPVTEIKKPATMPDRLPRLHGNFFDVKVVRHGLISDESNPEQQWITCVLGIRVSLVISGRGSICIRDIRLQTYKDNPHIRSLPPMVPLLPIKLDEENGTIIFQAFPQIEYLYEGKKNLPQALEAVLTDELGQEHLIHLKDGETIPELPYGYSAPRVRIVGGTMDNAGKINLTFKNIGNAKAQNVVAKLWIVAGQVARPMMSGVDPDDPNFVLFLPQFSTKDKAHTDGIPRTLEPGAEYIFSWPEALAEKNDVAGNYPQCSIRAYGEISYTYGCCPVSIAATFCYEPKIGRNGWNLDKCPGSDDL